MSRGWSCRGVPSCVREVVVSSGEGCQAVVGSARSSDLVLSCGTLSCDLVMCVDS